MTDDNPPHGYVPILAPTARGIGAALRLLREYPDRPAPGYLWSAPCPRPPNWHAPRWVVLLVSAAEVSARRVGFGATSPAVVERTVRHWFAWAVNHREDVLAVWGIGGDVAVEEVLRAEAGEVPSGAPEGIFER